MPGTENVCIRKAGPDDLAALDRLLTNYFNEHDIWERDSVDSLRGYLDSATLGFYVAEHGGRLVACVLLRPLPQIVGATECKRLYVLPLWRGRGLAALLMQAAEQVALSAGHDAIYLDSKAEFQAALALYARMGYEPCERFNDNAQATVFLRKRLAC